MENNVFTINNKSSNNKSSNNKTPVMKKRKVLKMIAAGDDSWEPLLPSVVSNMIKEQKLFGYSEKEVETP